MKAPYCFNPKFSVRRVPDLRGVGQPPHELIPRYVRERVFPGTIGEAWSIQLFGGGAFRPPIIILEACF